MRVKYLGGLSGDKALELAKEYTDAQLNDVVTPAGYDKIEPSDDLIISLPDVVSTSSYQYTKVAEVIVPHDYPEGAIIRVKFDLATSAQDAHGKVYFNDAAIGSLHNTDTVYPDFQTFSQDIDFTTLSEGDKIQLYIMNDYGETAYARNFNLYGKSRPYFVEAW